MTEVNGLPVLGYRPKTADAFTTVNNFKRLEEEILRALDLMKEGELYDQRWLAIGRTNLEQAFMAINRSVFKPSRVKLDGDE